VFAYPWLFCLLLLLLLEGGVLVDGGLQLGAPRA
jgi:hypothetical protein